MLVEKIQSLCRQKGTTLCAVERELGIGNGVIAKWANSSPRVGSLKKVADYFGVTVDELLQSAKEPREAS